MNRSKEIKERYKYLSLMENMRKGPEFGIRKEVCKHWIKAGVCVDDCVLK